MVYLSLYGLLLRAAAKVICIKDYSSYICVVRDLNQGGRSSTIYISKRAVTGTGITMSIRPNNIKYRIDFVLAFKALLPFLNREFSRCIPYVVYPDHPAGVPVPII